MRTTDNAGSATAAQHGPGILYPVMLIAAITLIVFSVVGIATMMGWMPNGLSSASPAAKDTTAARPGPARSPSKAGAATCRDCGVIESIRVVEAPGEGSGAGAVGGAVVGGVLGNQIGRGRGRAAATVVGAGAGAYAGHQIEKNITKSMSYEIHVRMNDGTYRTLHEPVQPALGVGQKVRVTERGISAAG